MRVDVDISDEKISIHKLAFGTTIILPNTDIIGIVTDLHQVAEEFSDKVGVVALDTGLCYSYSRDQKVRKIATKVVNEY